MASIGTAAKANGINKALVHILCGNNTDGQAKAYAKVVRDSKMKNVKTVVYMLDPRKAGNQQQGQTDINNHAINAAASVGEVIKVYRFDPNAPSPQDRLRINNKNQVFTAEKQVTP
ncbi:hypothetical protein VHEMI08958 [[Torrubiella] hemipterigena]|uniref:Uncharacterized protein n=1 Tax=[Torrubiella] hemipterigena TaxID=1531966 RepID=A0A0A1T8E3_9HYPO|nr:hypothetical protein VHEMI08958 [[Torrubiella] hemipterigena]